MKRALLAMHPEQKSDRASTIEKRFLTVVHVIRAPAPRSCFWASCCRTALLSHRQPRVPIVPDGIDASGRPPAHVSSQMRASYRLCRADGLPEFSMNDLRRDAVSHSGSLF